MPFELCAQLSQPVASQVNLQKEWILRSNIPVEQKLKIFSLHTEVSLFSNIILFNNCIFLRNRGGRVWNRELENDTCKLDTVANKALFGAKTNPGSSPSEPTLLQLVMVFYCHVWRLVHRAMF